MSRDASGTAQPRHRIAVPLAYLLAAAAMLAATVARINDNWIAAALLAAFPVLVVVAVIDSRSHRVPTRLVRFVGLTTAITVVGSAIAEGSAAPLARTLAAGTAVGAVYLVLNRVADVGLGDVRLAAVLGVLAGSISWMTVLTFVVATHFVAVPQALWHLTRRDSHRMAFAPALVTGLYLAVWVTTVR